MEKKKKDYVAPDIEVTQVEIESAICNGSAQFANENNDAGRIEAQGVDTSFGAGDNMGTYYSTWSNAPDQSQGPTVD